MSESSKIYSKPFDGTKSKHAAPKVNYFPELPSYTPPTEGLVSNLKAPLIPYAELMRLHKPTGY